MPRHQPACTVRARHLRGVWRGRARAQAMPWFIGGVLLLILSLGLIEDGTLLFAAHRRASLLAESAARAGASQLDVKLARTDPTAPPRLDASAAEEIARAYVLQQEPEAVVDATADGETIVVEVRLRVLPTVLHPPGQPAVAVVADGTAHPFVGLQAAEP
jgi:Putative Flp pilus-assembly TadE/G-like